jgi:hypothetical protein
LRKALDALPDDRETISAARVIIAFFNEHAEERVTPERISRATGLSRHLVAAVISALEEAFVLDCGGSEEPGCALVATPILSLEIQRYLRSSPTRGSKLQRGAQRFRDRYGSQ